MFWLQSGMVILFCYLIGSFPTGLIAGKLIRGVDVRDFGSGKTGATNTLRTLGIGPSVVVFLVDLAKGVLAVLTARYVLQNQWIEVAAALSAVVGHNWPVFAGFRGGRGVSASFGGAMAMMPWVSLICLGLFIVVVGVSRYVSLGSVLGALALSLVSVPFVLVGQVPAVYMVYGLVGGGLLIVQHRDNISRLLSGQERKLGQKAMPGLSELEKGEAN